MSPESWYALLSVAGVSLVSLIGVVLFFLPVRFLNTVVLIFVSFSSGSLFGNAFLHLLPETVQRHGFTLSVSLLTLAGVAASFFVEKVIHWRHSHNPSQPHVEAFAYMNLLGDAVHNFIDGIVITAAYLLDVRVGLATTLAVVVHEIPQEMSDFGVLLHGGFQRRSAIFFNLLTGVVALAGSVLTLLLSQVAAAVVWHIVPFAAGTFIYIAGADLIPQLHKEKGVGVSLLQLLFFAGGIVFMLILE